MHHHLPLDRIKGGRSGTVVPAAPLRQHYHSAGWVAVFRPCSAPCQLTCREPAWPRNAILPNVQPKPGGEGSAKVHIGIGHRGQVICDFAAPAPRQGNPRPQPQTQQSRLNRNLLVADIRATAARRVIEQLPAGARGTPPRRHQRRCHQVLLFAELASVSAQARATSRSASVLPAKAADPLFTTISVRSQKLAFASRASAAPASSWFRKR